MRLPEQLHQIIQTSLTFTTNFANFLKKSRLIEHSINVYIEKLFVRFSWSPF